MRMARRLRRKFGEPKNFDHKTPKIILSSRAMNRSWAWDNNHKVVWIIPEGFKPTVSSKSFPNKTSKCISPISISMERCQNVVHLDYLFETNLAKANWERVAMANIHLGQVRFFCLFFVFALKLWGDSKPQKSQTKFFFFFHFTGSPSLSLSLSLGALPNYPFQCLTYTSWSFCLVPPSCHKIVAPRSLILKASLYLLYALRVGEELAQTPCSHNISLLSYLQSCSSYEPSSSCYGQTHGLSFPQPCVHHSVVPDSQCLLGPPKRWWNPEMGIEVAYFARPTSSSGQDVRRGRDSLGSNPSVGNLTSTTFPLRTCINVRAERFKLPTFWSGVRRAAIAPYPLTFLPPHWHTMAQAIALIVHRAKPLKEFGWQLHRTALQQQDPEAHVV